MINQFARTEMLIGSEKQSRLAASRVIVFGVGGVGGYVAEALARAGIGAIDIVDNDIVSLTNLNRQIIALHSTIGQKKTKVMENRILDINPDAKVTARDLFLSQETIDMFDFSKYSYVVDAIDTVTSKILLACACTAAGVPIISCMGTGNKFDPTMLRIDDIYKTSVCPLAKVMRYELKKRGIKKLNVLYSREEIKKPVEPSEEETVKRSIPGSISFVPSAAGLIIAGWVIRDIADIR